MVGGSGGPPGPGGSHPRRAGTDPASTAPLDSLPLQRPLTTTCFLSGKQHQKWAMSRRKPFSQWIFTEQKSSVYVT